jgi:hypothetical protein
MSLAIALINNMLKIIATSITVNKKTPLFEVEALDTPIPKGAYLQIDENGYAKPVIDIAGSQVAQSSIAAPTTANNYMTRLYGLGNNLFLRAFGDTASTSTNNAILYEYDEATRELQQRHSIAFTGLSQYVLLSDGSHSLFEQLSDNLFVYCSSTQASGSVTAWTLKFLVINPTTKTISSPTFTITTAALTSGQYAINFVKRVRENVFAFFFSSNASTASKYAVYEIKPDGSGVISQTAEQSFFSGSAYVAGMSKVEDDVLLLRTDTNKFMLLLFNGVVGIPTQLYLNNGTAFPTTSALQLSLRMSYLTATHPMANSKHIILNDDTTPCVYAFSPSQTAEEGSCVLCKISYDKIALTSDISYYSEKNSNGFNAGYTYDLAQIDNDNLLFYGAASADYANNTHHFVARIKLNHTEKTYEVEQLFKVPFLEATAGVTTQYTTSLERVSSGKLIASRHCTKKLDAVIFPLEFSLKTRVDAVALNAIAANNIGLAYSCSEAMHMPLEESGSDVLGNYKVTSTKFAVKKL